VKWELFSINTMPLYEIMKGQLVNVEEFIVKDCPDVCNDILLKVA
jgi:hypothetical protein